MKTIYINSPPYTTLAVELGADEARIGTWGLGVDEYCGLKLTDTERLLLVAALLRPGETVTGVSEVGAMMKAREGGAV